MAKKLIVLVIARIICEIKAQTVSDCFEDSQKSGTFDEVFFLDEDVIFDEAVVLCEQNNAQLARVSSEEEFDHIDPFLSTNVVWVGAKRGINENISTSFRFVDGSSDISFHERPNQFPWNSNQPREIFTTERCIEWERIGIRFWVDRPCTELRKPLCRKRCSTSPSQAPTISPTFSPTSSPTFSPTTEPTLSPRDSPALEENFSREIFYGSAILFSLLVLISSSWFLVKKKDELKQVEDYLLVFRGFSDF